MGDVIILETGCKVPADCVVINSSDLEVDEEHHYEGEHVMKKKQQLSEDDDTDDTIDPFLLSDSFITTGNGIAVICAVGDSSTRKQAQVERLGISDEQTPLQRRLDAIGLRLSLYGLYASLIITLAMIVNLIIASATGLEADKIVQRIVETLTLFIALIVVAVPEGLPLAVGIALAYSAVRMKEDNILVKNI